jgi:hypothetical protein
VNTAQVFDSAIAALDSVTKAVQETIRCRPWIDEDLFGKPVFGATRKYKGVVDRSKREVRTEGGQIISVTAMITFLRPFPAIGAAGREEPLDFRDQLFLQDDTTGPIISIRGSINPGTNQRYFLQVTLG